MQVAARLVAAILGLWSASSGLTQSVAELRQHYSGATKWNPAEHTLTFASSGTIHFDKPDHKSALWDVPEEVGRIVLRPDVRVTGAFHTRADCIIQGEDRRTSVVFGTPEQRWADSRGVKPFEYCQFQNRGGVLTVSNLTALNPLAYFIRGWGQVCHAWSCDFLDDRGGWGNHSDGFAGGHGSTINDCHFETGDDAIKLYFDIAVTNTSIRMIQNCVPFQFGWGTYQASTSRICNVTITGERGRGKARPVFQWVAGSDEKHVEINGLAIENPNASLFELKSQGRLDLDVIGARIRVKDYGTPAFRGTREICSGTNQSATYDCPVRAPRAGGEASTY